MTQMLIAAALVAAVAIALESRARHPAFYILKPLATALVIAAVLLAPAVADRRYALWVEVALALCLAGDIALLFEGMRAFVAGLCAFLVAHAFFIVAFLHDTVWSWPPLAGALAVLLPAALLSAVLLRRAGPMAPAVLLYQLALLGMAASAWMRWHAQADRSAFGAFCGALLFLASDALLGWRQFVGPFRAAQALILSSYWLAIGLIARSV